MVAVVRLTHPCLWWPAALSVTRASSRLCTELCGFKGFSNFFCLACPHDFKIASASVYGVPAVKCFPRYYCLLAFS